MKLKNLLALVCFFVIPIASYSQGNINLIKEKAQKGDAQAQYYLGWCYFNGQEGLAIDYRQGVMWLEKSANQDYEPAQYFMGWCYYYGEGVTSNKKLAYQWYMKSAEKGNTVAQSMVKLIGQNVKDIPNYSKDVASFDKFDPANPPSLEIVINSVQFIDPNGNNAIDANESCAIRLIVKNTGKGDAYNCSAKIFSADVIKGLSMHNVSIPVLKVNESKTIELPIYSDMQMADGNVNLYVQIYEPHGFGTDPMAMNINTRKFEAPLLQVVDYAVTSIDGSSVLQKKKAFDMQVLLQNTKTGNADDVVVSIELPDNVLLMEKQKEEAQFNHISGGETKSIVYPLIVNNEYKDTKIPVKINIQEKYGKYAENKVVELSLNQSLASNKIIVEEKGSKQQNFNIKIASIGSDVDKNIPETNASNDKTFALVIANESYNKESGVPFATNDGKIFSEYCKQTLGLPESNVHFVANATLNDIRHEVKWIKEIIGAFNGEAKVIMYYAGHGIPDEKEKTAYLLPVDGYGSDVTTGYSLENLYTTLSELPSKSVTVFLDACFSGAKREGDMLASARGIAIKVKQTEPRGNLVVFSAAQGDETAYPYKEQGHGMFTYFLLKKLQETKGDVTLGELGDFVKTQVVRQSVVVNGKMQTPALLPSATIGDNWKSWKLR